MTAAKKFALISCLVLSLLVGMIVAFYMLCQANENEVKAYRSQYKSYLLADETRQSSDDLTRMARTFVSTGDPRFLDQYQAVLDIRNGKKPRPRDYHRIYWDFVAAGKTKPRPDTVKNSLLDLMKKAGFSQEEFNMLKEAGKRSNNLVLNETKAIDLVRNTSPDQPDYQQKLAQARELVFNETYHKDKAYIMEATDKFYDLLGKRLKSNVKEANSTRTTWKVTASVLLILLAIALVLFTLLFISILKQLGEDPGYLYRASHEIAGGNLDFAFRGGQQKQGVYSVFCKMVAAMKDKIQEAEIKTKEAARESERAQEATEQAIKAKQQAEKAKAEGMLAAANSLSEIVERVSSAAEELSAQVEQASKGASSQRERVQETAAAMEEMNATVLEVAENASGSAEGADTARTQALEGQKVVQESVDAITEVQKQTLGLKEGMEALGEQAEGIGHVMNVISDIADQTNLLALNAAIEAARAGDAGRGFAVVADEVRKLAEKTMDATKEVGSAISSIQQGTKDVVLGMDQSVAGVEAATDLVTKSGESLNGIVSLVESASDQVRSIATASEEQSATSEEINRSVDEINRISTETAQAMEESARAVAELAKQAQELNTLIRDLKSA